jgi:phosphohistidine swiveling domain-containing protein
VRYIFNFDQVDNNKYLFGSKAINLSRMYKLGFPVPKGFIISSDLFKELILESDVVYKINKIIKIIDFQSAYSVSIGSKKIRRLIMSVEFPEKIILQIKENFIKLNTSFVAVRSSTTIEDGTKSTWAGQFHSYINICESNLINKIKECWASLFTERSLTCVIANNKINILTAVIVQKMVTPEISGIAFTTNPINQDNKSIIVEFGLGLGQAFVSGKINPNLCIIDKINNKIIYRKKVKQYKKLVVKRKGGIKWVRVRNDKFITTFIDKYLENLIILVKKIEKKFNFSCDIEWAYCRGNYYVLQNRVITTVISKPVVFRNKKQHVINEMKELVQLDAPLSFLELHYSQEVIKNIPWSKNIFTIRPYIIYKVTNGHARIFYDTRGMSWQRDNAWRYKNKKHVFTKIKKDFDDIREILLMEKLLSQDEFIIFIQKVRDIWPWINYIWWSIEFGEENHKAVNDFMMLRKYTEHFIVGLISVMRKFINKKFNKLRAYTDVLRLDEVMLNKIPAKNILDKRIAGYVYTNNKVYSSLDYVLKKFLIRIKDRGYYEQCPSGQIAYPGKVLGYVRVVLKGQDVNKFKQNEILVASTTTPDYLLAIIKSSAIISEHGGIICHASIISRELKIPCIVGVSNITKILKTGDFIEVNANNGTIKIIKHNS